MNNKAVIEAIVNSGLVENKNKIVVTEGPETLICKVGSKLIFQCGDDMSLDKSLFWGGFNKTWICVHLERLYKEYAVLVHLDRPRIITHKVTYLECGLIMPSRTTLGFSGIDFELYWHANNMKTAEQVEEIIEQYKQDSQNPEELEYHLRKLALCKRLLAKMQQG